MPKHAGEVTKTAGEAKEVDQNPFSNPLPEAGDAGMG